MRKYILVCFLKLEDLPPVVTLIKELSEYSKIDYIGINDKNEYYDNLFNGNVDFYNVFPFELGAYHNLYEHIYNFIHWRMMPVYLNKAMKIIKKNYSADKRIWVLHEFTMRHLKKEICNYPYYLTMYELNSRLFEQKDNLFKHYIKQAKKVIVPEYTRASIVQACVGLKELPIVLPNKPFEYTQEEIELKDNKFEKVADKLHKEGKKIILYSGIFIRERKLDTIIEAVSTMQDKYQLVLLGQESPYLHELLEKYKNIVYAGFVKAPKHLSIVKHADIGILTYVADSGSINPVFCAPNKIWEYAKYGIPMICNDIPGLKFTVEYNNIGCCFDINDVKDIKEKLELIEQEYEVMSQQAKKYYESINVSNIIESI